MLRNRITENIKYETEVLPFPLQTRLLAPLKAAALSQGRTDLVNFWCGQSAVSLKHKKAAELMRALVEETSAIVRSSLG
jgi:nitronate monooxygenase